MLLLLSASLDLVDFLVVVRDGIEETLGVAWGAGEIGGVVDDDHGASDPACIALTIGARVVIAPLREPGAKRRESCEPDRAVVHDLRIAQITHPHFAV